MPFPPSCRAAVMLAATLVLLCACGRAGPLEAPPTAEALKKQTDPRSMQMQRPNPKITPPDTPFALDPLVK